MSFNIIRHDFFPCARDSFEYGTVAVQTFLVSSTLASHLVWLVAITTANFSILDVICLFQVEETSIMVR